MTIEKLTKKSISSKIAMWHAMTIKQLVILVDAKVKRANLRKSPNLDFPGVLFALIVFA